MLYNYNFEGTAKTCNKCLTNFICDKQPQRPASLPSKTIPFSRVNLLKEGDRRVLLVLCKTLAIFTPCETLDWGIWLHSSRRILLKMFRR